MSISIYDFDTRYAPFEAFAPYTPFAPVAVPMLLLAPAFWWMDVMLGMYGACSEAMVSAMSYPFMLSTKSALPSASSAKPAVASTLSAGQNLPKA
jgi:hypothetical protein